MDYKVLHVNKNILGTGRPSRYNADGNGRDYYISYNNAGLYKEVSVPQGSHKSGIVNKKFFHIG
jgi:hypothetical protein